MFSGGGQPMPHFLLQCAYTSEAWAALTKNPQNRFEAVRPMLEGLGARIESAYLSFGDYDLVLILEAPDNVTAAAISVAVSAGGAAKAIKTTPLLTPEEGVQVMTRAASSGYQPPG
jgi:uncharacterized protein with GYD domain